MEWRTNLTDYVAKKPMAVLRFAEAQWIRLEESKNGTAEFTVTRSRHLFGDFRLPTAAILVGFQKRQLRGFAERQEKLFIAKLSSKSSVTTDDIRIKIKFCLPILGDFETDLMSMVTEKNLFGILRRRLESKEPVIQLSPRLSQDLVNGLASIKENHTAMKRVSDSLREPKGYSEIRGIQLDAIKIALDTVSLDLNAPATSIYLDEGSESALSSVSLLESSVIEHDARTFQGLELIKSDMTGRAVFEANGEKLEIFTANQRPLEQVFGVDLIYLNVVHRNMVMLQYKMLERDRSSATDRDWIYRPDEQMEEEIHRMRKFKEASVINGEAYRFNGELFYMKFVKRDSVKRNGGILLPLPHYEQIARSKQFEGPKGGVRMSFKSLAGKYLREHSFADLTRSGYIGTGASTTEDLMRLVDLVLRNGKGVVGAIKQAWREEDSRIK